MLSRPRPPSKPIRRTVRRSENVSGGLRHLALRLIQPLTSRPLSSPPYPLPRLPQVDSGLCMRIHLNQSTASVCLPLLLSFPAFFPLLLLLSPVETNKGAGNPAANASLLDGSATEAAFPRRRRCLDVVCVCMCVWPGEGLCHFLCSFFMAPG